VGERGVRALCAPAPSRGDQWCGGARRAATPRA
jgi:hypothetical protein